MARPKKSELSPAVGTVASGRKRGNPDFVSSSFYVPKKVNIGFDRALLTLKAAGFDIDRSDILSVLMDRFATAVGAAEQQGDELNLESILAAASDGLRADGADVSVLKRVMRESIQAGKTDLAQARQEMDDQLQAVGELQKSQGDLRRALAKRQMGWMTKQGIGRDEQLAWMKEQGFDPEELSSPPPD